jgi:hypothetical protein
MRVSCCGASSLTRGWICNLLVQLLLGLVRAVTLGSGSHRTHYHILLSHLRLPQPGGQGLRINIPSGTGWPSYTPGHWVLYSSPLTTRSYGGGILTRLHTGSTHKVKVKVLLLLVIEVEIKLRPTVSRRVRLGVRHPSGTRDQFFFLLKIFFRQLWVCYFVAPSLTRGRVCNLLLNYS